MSVFMVERYLVGWSPDEVHELIERTNELAPALADDQVRHVASVYIEADETCLCLFDGPDCERVQAANERHRLPFGRIVESELVLGMQ
ncbi:MAG: nickel-binding protein [Ilumatobacteraceae bacterium]